MVCPVCKVELKLSERQGVEIDYCPQCRGVWLDRGELDKILERSAGRDLPRSEERMPAPPAPRYEERSHYSRERDHDDRHERHPHGRRKSFLDDLFDFG